MATITVRNLPEATRRALKVRAAYNGRSTEAEIREILNQAVNPPERIKVGSALAAFGKRYGGIDLGGTRDRAPTEPAEFE
jgi:plasmid stability protein